MPAFKSGWMCVLLWLESDDVRGHGLLRWSPNGGSFRIPVRSVWLSLQSKMNEKERTDSQSSSKIKLSLLSSD